MIVIQKITIYLDFDGVFNIPPNNADKIIKKPKTTSIFLRNKKNVAVNSEVLNSFRALLDTGYYNVKWLTTWNHESGIHAILPMLDLDDHITFIYPNINKNSNNKRQWTEWKAKAIIKDQEQSPSPFIWVDDRAPKYWDDLVKTNTTESSLIITPQSSIGLTTDHIIHMIDWSQTVNLERTDNNG